MRKLAILFALLAACFTALPAQAQVLLSFHSFNGSVLFGRFPHTFIVLEGTLEATGARVNENYGFSGQHATPAVLRGPVVHMIYIEQPKYIRSTNRHFTVPISDETYAQIVAEVAAWRNIPGRGYDLERRNCIHFVGRMAELAGLKFDVPQAMLRRPKQWLNHIAALNPQLHARQID